MAGTGLAAISDEIEAAAARAARGAVRVGGEQGTSGVVWADGLIVTAEETLTRDEGVRVLVPDGREVAAELAGRDPSTDVALLKVAGVTAPGWEIGEPPGLGALVLAVGRGNEGPRAVLSLVATAGGAWTSLAGGRIDALARLAALLPAALEGAPALDMRGRLLGMAVAGPRRRGLLIPAATIARAVERLVARGYVARGYLGLALRPVSAGLLVHELVEGGPAETAGFVIGDVITTWNGELVRTMRDLARRLGPEAAGATVEIGLLRGGRAEARTVTIGERRPERSGGGRTP